MPLLHLGRLDVTIDRVQQRVVGVYERIRGIALCPKILDRQASVRRRFESDCAVKWVGKVQVANDGTTWRIEGLSDEEGRIESGAGEGERTVLLASRENAVATAQYQSIGE